jgi:hypothetical protein
MKHAITAQDVLSDIEFEIIQGAISRDELGESIQTVRQYQNKLRSYAFPAEQPAAAAEEILSRQFQLNDMLLTLLQETAATLQSMRLYTQWFEQRRPHENLSRAGWRGNDGAEQPITYLAARGDTADAGRPFTQDSAVATAESTPWPATAAVKTAMQSDTLRVRPDMRPVGIPMLGGLLGRLRFALHSLVLFYVNRLGQAQTAVNQSYGHELLALNARAYQQQRELDALHEQVAALQARLEQQAPINDGEG